MELEWEDSLLRLLEVVAHHRCGMRASLSFERFYVALEPPQPAQLCLDKRSLAGRALLLPLLTLPAQPPLVISEHVAAEVGVKEAALAPRLGSGVGSRELRVQRDVSRARSACRAVPSGGAGVRRD
eukprot:2305362-Pleurochrysis_carterae.AAC.3